MGTPLFLAFAVPNRYNADSGLAISDWGFRIRFFSLLESAVCNPQSAISTADTAILLLDSCLLPLLQSYSILPAGKDKWYPEKSPSLR
jgi:hypothetical protein